MLTTGTFDGVHKGHRAILDELKATAERVGGETVMLTFFPHPRMVLHPEDHGLRLLNSPEEKQDRLKAAGIDHLIVHPFTPEFARMTALEYVRDLLVRDIKVHTVVVGYDHHFGRNREGDFSDLMDFADTYQFEVEEISASQIDEVNVSSTKIRHALLEGQVAQANRFLGYRYPISGTVVHGREVGRTLGMPTANIQPDFKWKLTPGIGVYAAWAVVDGARFPAAVNIGMRPTIGKDEAPTIEAHLIGFQGDLYDRKVTLEFDQRIREERKFSDLEALKAQMLLDREQASKLQP